MYMPMIPDAIEQAAPTRKAIAVRMPIGAPASVGTSATSAVSTSGDHHPDHDRRDEGEQGDRRVLATDERDRALEDRAGDVLHLLGPGVARQDVAGEVDREQHGDDAGRQDDQLERTRIHQGCRILLDMVCGRDPARARATRRSGRVDRGEVAGSRGHPPWGGTLQAGRECIKAREAGSNSAGRFDMQAPA